jgi:FMN phosphatase YigB (HAD superfamily)
MAHCHAARSPGASGKETAHMRGVLFDLDGTLLGVEVNEFLKRYFRALSETVAPRFPGIDLVGSVLASTAVMQGSHPGVRNREVFFHDFRDRTGVDLDEHWPVFEAFYRDVFPTLGTDYRPVPGGREAIEAARSLGWKVGIATQPIFPLQAIQHRLAWAGLADVEFDAITTYEVMTACKPDPAYFAQVCSMIGCAPADCVMVGDDAVADMSAAELGIGTFFVGAGHAEADGRGTLADLPALFERMECRS